MDGLKIFWTNADRRQRNHVFRYWNVRNKSNRYSRELNQAIRTRIDLLKVYPKIGKSTNFKNTRAITLRHYSILYRIQPTRIIITAFWDNRGDPEKLLKLIQSE